MKKYGQTMLLAVCAATFTMGLAQSSSAQDQTAQPTTPPVGATQARPTETIQLGARASEEQATDWRNRRLRDRGRLFESRGYRLTQDDIDDLLIRANPSPDIPRELVIDGAKILRGLPTTELLHVGMLLGGTSMAEGYSRCTVILTKPDTVVTARHCIAYPHGHQFWVYFPYEGVVGVDMASIDLFCKENDTTCSKKVDDLAIVKLDAPFNVIPPTYAGSALNASLGQAVTIVGYGISGKDASDYAIKRSGTVAISGCSAIFASADLSLCFDGLDGINLAQSEESEAQPEIFHVNCNNDSGGPMLSPSSPWDKIVGVASQLAGGCDGAGQGRYVNVTNAKYSSWLNSAFCNPACTVDPNIVLAELAAVPISSLTETSNDYVQTLTVPPNTATVIVTLNHSRGRFPGPNHLDLELPASLNATCERFIEIEVCRAEDPNPGDYDAKVVRLHGDTEHVEFQLSAVALANIP